MMEIVGKLIHKKMDWHITMFLTSCKTKRASSGLEHLAGASAALMADVSKRLTPGMGLRVMLFIASVWIKVDKCGLGLREELSGAGTKTRFHRLSPSHRFSLMKRPTRNLASD